MKRYALKQWRNCKWKLKESKTIFMALSGESAMIKRYYDKFDMPKSITNKGLLRIIDFYLFNCPTPDISVRGKNFKDYGFIGQASFSCLKREMMKRATSSLKNNYWPCKSDELESKFQLVKSVSPPDEYCVFLKWQEDTVMQSLFSAIRNSLAHGSFNVKSYNGVRIYFFINYKDYKKAQIVLQEKTLLEWINLIQSGYEALSPN